ncbi:MAG: DUF968 domain-containing protein [Gallionellaceae bacterium]
MQKAKPIRSEPYLKYIRTLPCCHCGTSPAGVAHHFIGHNSAMGSKAGDHMAMPLCAKDHADFHAVWVREDKDLTVRVQAKWLDDTQSRAIRDGDFQRRFEGAK